LFTKIIAATVAPLKKSSDNSLAGAEVAVKDELILGFLNKKTAAGLIGSGYKYNKFN
jgi:hypothetical protein